MTLFTRIIMLSLISMTIVESNDVIKIMSFNFPTTKLNNLQKLGTMLNLSDNSKTKRFNSAIELINVIKADFICFQETHTEDITKLVANKYIKSHYNYYAPTINDSDGVVNAIFYPKNYTVLDKGIIYLNKDQKKGLKSWDDKHYRACTWIYVGNPKKIGQQFYIFNLHLGLSPESRENSLKIIYDKAEKLRQANILSFIVGDFNAKPAGPTFKSVEHYGFTNIKELTPLNKIMGPSFSYAGYDNKSKKSPDHIIVTMPEKIKALEFITLKKTTGTQPSDHFPIMAMIELK